MRADIAFYKLAIKEGMDIDPQILVDLEAKLKAFTTRDRTYTGNGRAFTSDGRRFATYETGGLFDAAHRGMANGRKLNAIVRVKYDNDPQKLAAWTVASHLEKAPKAAAAPTP